MTVRPPRSERIFRLLLRAYPADFRDRYGEDTVELFRDRRREARARGGAGALLRLWVRTVPSVLVHGLLERVGERRENGDSGFRVALSSAWRSIVRAPALSATIVLTLGVGIGANVALFSLLKGVLLEPLPFPQAERLVRVWETNPDVDGDRHQPSPLNLYDWGNAARGFDGIAGWYFTSGTYRTEAWTEALRSARVTHDFFRVLGVSPALGRDFPAESGGTPPLMLSHGVWQRLFGGDPAVIGTTIVSSGTPYEIVGVMPDGFDFPDESVETWIGLDIPALYAGRPETRTWRFLNGIGRLAAETSVAEAEAELDAVAAGLAEAHPVENRGWDAAVTSLHDELVGPVRGTLWLGLGSVALILLIACANVANLLLARVPVRSRDLAVRATLGADRRTIVRGLLAEAAILAGAAGLLGLGLGALTLRLLVVLDAGRIPRLDEVGIDGTVFLFTALVATLTAVLAGVVPSLATLRASVARSLRDGTRTTAGAGQRRARDVFVAAQVAVALVLLTAAGLFSASFERLTGVDPGLDPVNVATFRVALDPGENAMEETVVYYDGVMEALERLPGVVAAGAAQTLPFSPVANDFQRPYRPLGSELASADASPVQMRMTTPSYLEAIGMRLVAGEPLPEAAGLEDPLVALVNETLARRLWPDGDAVGQSFEIDFRNGWEPYRVVGVVQDVKHYGLREATAPEVFLSHRQIPYLAMNVVVRTVGDPAAMTERLRAAVASQPPTQPAHDFAVLEELVASSTAEERFLSILLAVLAAVALGLASTGVYGIISWSVTHRRREIGVRMALGAESQRVVRDVLWGAVRVALAGLLIGFVTSRLVAGAFAGLLYGVEPGDATAHLGGAVLLLAVATVAAWLPARAAAHVQPTEALRPD